MLPESQRLRRTFAFLTACTLAVFAALLIGLTAVLRQRLRAEVLDREAEAIHAVAQMQIDAAEDRLRKLGVDVTTSDIFAAVLESSRLRGVLAVQLFDATGALSESVPPVAPEFAERNRWWSPPLKTATARFHRDGRLEEALGITPDEITTTTRTPLLEVVVPVASRGTASPPAAARYWIDGTPLKAEFARLDANLAAQAAIALAGGGVLVALLLVWAYRRLAHAQQQLLAQSADLARANQELDFAAKTGALGAISAHLIHGLKNPLAGLEGFVHEATASDPAITGEARQTAIETTRRLRMLVNDVVSVLRDESTGSADYPVPLREVIEAVRARSAPAATAAGIELNVIIASEATVTARTGNLAGLVLANLLTNAIEASAWGQSVQLEARALENDVEFIVADQGTGLPTAVRTSLFRPVMSTKRSGGGMGLAISHRLARHAGGELVLVRSDRHGTIFRLRVPIAPRKA